jgi:hypothetical protein
MDILRYRSKDLTTTAVTDLEDFKSQFGVPDLDTVKYLRSEGDCNHYQFMRKGNLFYNYKLNNCNFRGSNWDLTSTKPKIGFFGCSFTFGEMVEVEHIFPTIVSRKIDYNGFNFGVPGVGIQTVGRTFSAANKLFDFEYAVVTLPDWSRINYLNDDSNGVSYKDISLSTSVGLPSYILEDLKLYQMLNESICVQRMIDTVDWILDIAQYKSTKVIFSSWSDPVSKALEQLYPDYSIDPFPIVDTVADNDHPAEQSHQRYADMIVRRINELT